MWKPNRKDIDSYIVQGFVRAEQHPSLPLTIYNYTAKTQFDRKWTDVTKACRGLILHDDGRVIARPFPKFFNFDELSRSWNPPSKTFTVTTKEDGCLGILYRTPDGVAMATRGSFVGPQAIRATQMIQQYADLPWDTDRFTYLFEVIYPENKIVVDYGKDERLVLLAVIETKTGKDVDLPDWFPNCVQSWPDYTDLGMLKSLATPNAEGFVIRFKNGTRVKVKFDEYVRLHKLYSGINERTIWEYLSEGKDLDELIDAVPDELHQWVRDTATRIEDDFYRIVGDVSIEHYDPARPQTDDRKVLAEYFSRCKYPHVHWLSHDGNRQKANKAIWDLVKPKGAKPYMDRIAA